LLLIISLVSNKYHQPNKKQQEIATERPPIKSLPPSEEEIKNASDKNYQRRGNCQFCQATGLLEELGEKDLPDLTAKKRIGAVNSLFVKARSLFEKGMELHESE